RQTGTVPGVPPDGDPVPPSGELPAASLESGGSRGFGVYVHGPFCASRCGYCDFNTYTADELGGAGPRETYVDSVLAELALATRVLDGAAPPAETVFFGGGTPTLLTPDELGRILAGVDAAFGLAA